jgi:hypothetical protein
VNQDQPGHPCRASYPSRLESARVAVIESGPMSVQPTTIMQQKLRFVCQGLHGLAGPRI